MAGKSPRSSKESRPRRSSIEVSLQGKDSGSACIIRTLLPIATDSCPSSRQGAKVFIPLIIPDGIKDRGWKKPRMSLGLRDPYERRRRQRRWMMIRSLILVALVGGALWIAYRAGRQVGQAQIDALKDQIGER